MLHRINAIVDADKQGDKARFKRLAGQEHKAERNPLCHLCHLWLTFMR